MEIVDKKLFLESLLNLRKSVNNITCCDEKTLEDFLYFAKEADEKISDGQPIIYNSRKEWIQEGPIFIIFNEKGLMHEVNSYIMENM